MSMKIIDQKIQELTNLLKQIGDQQNNLLNGGQNKEEREKEKKLFSSNAEKVRNLIKSIRKEFDGKTIFEYEEKLKQIDPQLKTAELMIDTMESQFIDINEQSKVLEQIENEVIEAKEKPEKKENPVIEHPKKKKKCLIM